MKAENISIRDRLSSGNDKTQPVAQGAGGIDTRAYQDLKHRVHQTLLDRVDLEGMQRLSPEQIRDELRMLVERLLHEETIVINESERKSLVRDIQNEMLGFGPRWRPCLP